LKSIKIKLNKLNGVKYEMLDNIFNQMEALSAEYLKLRLNELETKTYKPFKAHYADFRLKYPLLNSGMLQYRLRNVDKNLKSYISWCKKKHKLVSFPETIKADIPLRNDRFSFEYSKNTKDFNGWLKTLKIHFPLNLCKYHLKSLEQASKICDSSIIKDSKGHIYLRLCFETIPKTHQGSKRLGVDVGMVKPIVCSNGKTFGSGKYIKHKKIEFGKKRSRNQKLVQTILNKQSNWTADLNHKLSRELVDYCISTGVNVLVLEKLKGSELSNRKYRKFTWAFKDLLTKIEYKAQNEGIKVISVNPAYTSQTCSACGSKSKDNRKSQSLFHCTSCNSKVNADVNAAKNILSLSTQNGLNVNLTSCNALNNEARASLAHG